MAAIWWTSSTFNHCLLIPPIIAWLVWQRLPRAARSWRPPPGRRASLLVGAGALGWLLGEAGGVAFARHLGLVLMLQGAVDRHASARRWRAGSPSRSSTPCSWSRSARSWCRPMQTRHRARSPHGLLALTGVPAHLEGIFITTPTGYFEVAEACAGVRS